ncbi:MAG: MFS transporter [Nocardioidaceae bacterium]
MRAGRILGRDFRWLWAAYTVTEVGSAVGAGALPLIAVLVLNVSTLQVTMLAALSGLASAAIALPLGSQIEFRRKRPLMVTADWARFLALGSVPVAAKLGSLSYAQLCVVGVVQGVGTIAFNAASGAHLKTVVPEEQRLSAASRFATTLWAATSVGPPLGGLLISWFGATVTLAVDAVSFLLSAVGIRSLRSPEPPPEGRTADHRWRHDLGTGWRYILDHRELAALFWNSLIFGGCIMAGSSLMAVFMLRDLGFSPWQYGLALGLPGVGGIFGSLAAGPLTRRFGPRGVLLGSGVLRSVWMGLIPLAQPGVLGLTLIVVSETLLLFSAGVFNPSFTTFRMNATADSHMARVLTSWSITSKTAQPMFIAVAGLLASLTNERVALAVAAVLLLSSVLVLPWRPRRHDQGPATDVPGHLAPGRTNNV